MNPQYLEKLTSILQRAQHNPLQAPSFQFKQSFGAVAAYVDGRIFAVCGKFGFGLKLPPQRCAELIAEQDGAPLRYFPKGHVKKSYVLLPERVLEASALISGIVAESIGFVSNSAP